MLVFLVNFSWKSIKTVLVWSIALYRETANCLVVWFTPFIDKKKGGEIVCNRKRSSFSKA